jgi:hypothetical protein
MCAIGVTLSEAFSDTCLGRLFERRLEMVATSITFREYRATKNFYLPFFNYFPSIKPVVESLTPLKVCELPRKYCLIKYT